MKSKECLVILLCTAAVMLVKSESTIEIDKNGDEYEVKKFNIQGRRMNEGRSQCVVTRRKRASLPKPMYSNDDSNDQVDDYTIRDESDQSMLFYTPPLLTFTAEEAEGGKEKEEVENNMGHIKEDKKEGAKISNIVKGNTNTSEEMPEQEQDNREESDGNAVGLMQQDELSVLGQIQNNGEPEATVAPANEESDANANANAIVVLQSHAPPKVNPQTHAVFALVPINHINVQEDNEYPYYVDEVNGEFELEDGLTPITPTDIWLTGGDSSNEIYDDYGSKPLRAPHIAKQTKKPLKIRKQKKKKPTLKPKRKNKYNNGNANGLINANRRRNNKRRPNKTNIYGPIDTRRRVANKNKPSNGNRIVAVRNKNRKNIVIIAPGTHHDGDDDDENINCIIIRKEPPSTPAPSFWNIFAHNDRSSPRVSGQFGKRKRVSMRFLV